MAFIGQIRGLKSVGSSGVEQAPLERSALTNNLTLIESQAETARDGISHLLGTHNPQQIFSFRWE
jgi:hypothetical protein